MFDDCIDSPGCAIEASDWLHGKLASPIFFFLVCLVLCSDCMHVRHPLRTKWYAAACTQTQNIDKLLGMDGSVRPFMHEK